jgi:adenosylcobinamide amidohydrolase
MTMAGKKGAKERTPKKVWTKDQTDKFVEKVAKQKGIKPADAHVFLIGYAANRMATLERNAKAPAPKAAKKKAA